MMAQFDFLIILPITLSLCFILVIYYEISIEIVIPSFFEVKKFNLNFLTVGSMQIAVTIIFSVILAGLILFVSACAVRYFWKSEWREWFFKCCHNLSQRFYKNFRRIFRKMPI